MNVSRPSSPQSQKPREFIVYTSLLDHLSSSQVWLTLQPEIKDRSIAKITNPAGNKSVYCRVLVMDEPYLDLYNRCPERIEHVHLDGDLAVPDDDYPQAIALSRWYRNRLGQLQIGQSYPLRVVRRNGIIAQYRVNLDDPDQATALGLNLTVWTFIGGTVIAILGLVGGVLTALFVPHI